MKELLNVVLCIVFLFNVGGCEKDEPLECSGDSAEQVDAFYNEEFATMQCFLRNIGTTEKHVNLIIETQSDYEKYFDCTSTPPIVDFEKYSMLAGRFQHHQCARFDSQQVLLCNNKLYYKVGLREQDCQAITNVFYMVVIEKKHENTAVTFEVNFTN